MSLTILPDLMQGTEEWLEQRRGMVTASVVGRLLTPTLKVASNETSRGLAHSLTAERITGHVDSTYASPDMWRGHEEEPLARDAYAQHRGVEVQEVGLMVRDDWGFRIGYSPDGLVGDDGLIEVKSRLQKHHLAHVLADQVPPENMAQLQCGLLVSGREWIDYLSFCGGMALWTKRVTPDPDWQTAILTAVEAFEKSVADLIAHYRAATAGLPMTERAPDYTEIVI